MSRSYRAFFAVAVILSTSISVHAATGWNNTPPDTRHGRSHLIPDPPPITTHTMMIHNGRDGHEFRSFVAIPAGIEAPKEISAVILIHGSGSWDRHAMRWMPMARELARLGYVAIYPDIRYLDIAKGPSDCRAVSEWITNHGIDKIGIVGGSAGNNPVLSSVQLFSDKFDAYVNLYGGLGIASWGHLDEERILSMDAPVLMEVGGEDARALENAELLSWRISDLHPGLPQHLRVYSGEGHGFFFGDSPGAQRAQSDFVAFLDWSLRDGPKPHWYAW